MELSLSGVKLKTLVSSVKAPTVSSSIQTSLSSSSVPITDDEDDDNNEEKVQADKLFVGNAVSSSKKVVQSSTSNKSSSKASMKGRAGRAFSLSSRVLETLPAEVKRIFEVKSKGVSLQERKGEGGAKALKEEIEIESPNKDQMLDTPSLQPFSLSPVRSFPLSEADQSALKLGRLVLAKAQSEQQHGIEALSRFFLDTWLSKNDSDSHRADTLSIQLMCALQKMKSLNVKINSEGEDNEGNGTEASKKLGAVALECFDLLIEEFGAGNPVLQDIRDALLPLIFVRPVDKEVFDIQYLFGDKSNVLNGQTYLSAYTWRENIVAKIHDARLMGELEPLQGQEAMEAKLVYLHKVNEELNIKTAESEGLNFKMRLKLDRMAVNHATELQEKEFFLKQKDSALVDLSAASGQKISLLTDRVGSLETELVWKLLLF